TLPERDEEFSTRWSAIKGSFSRHYLKAGGIQGRRNPSRRRSGEAAIWQRRFWEHFIRDEGDFQKHLDYIHFNPVKHGYVDSPREWPWSSFHRYVRKGWYHEEWGEQEPQTIKDFECE
ncbi:MAG: transposase, partial [Thermoanaerobaculia bacterium]